MVAVGSRTLGKAEAFVQETRSESAKPYGSYEEVLAQAAVHGVYIPLPTSLHLEWVKKAAAAGKHILLEKPIALVSFMPVNRKCQFLPQSCALAILQRAILDFIVRDTAGSLQQHSFVQEGLLHVADTWCHR